MKIKKYNNSPNCVDDPYCRVNILDETYLHHIYIIFCKYLANSTSQKVALIIVLSTDLENYKLEKRMVRNYRCAFTRLYAEILPCLQMKSTYEY